MPTVKAPPEYSMNAALRQGPERAAFAPAQMSPPGRRWRGGSSFDSGLGRGQGFSRSWQGPQLRSRRPIMGGPEPSRACDFRHRASDSGRDTDAQEQGEERGS
jgi:hypothetical protein